MRHAPFSGLTARMLLFAAAALLPVLLLMAYTEWRNAGARVAQERTRAAHLAEVLAREQVLPFALGRQKLRDLALLRELAAPYDRRACREALLRAVMDSPYLQDIALFAADGEAICASVDPLPAPAAGRDYFKEALRTGRMTVSDYFASSRDGAGVVAMALPLAAAQGGTGLVLRAGLDLAWLARALDSVPVAEDTNIVVVDSRGMVLAPQRWAGKSVAEHAVFKRVSGIASATSFEAVGIDGVERIFVARPLNQEMGGRAYLWVAVPKSSATKAVLRDFLGSTALVFVTVLVLFAVIWREGSRMVLLPVRRLREAAQRLAGSQLSARTNLPHSDDEIGQLAAAFDEMAGKIETRERELDQRVQERTADLEQANRELEAFSYSLSHDLRAPLRAIDGFAHALDEECGHLLKAECRDFLSRIRNSANRMNGLIEDMIRLGRISNQDIHADEVDLSSLASEIGRELAAAEPARAVRLAVVPGLAACGDPGLLRVLLRNLMVNAWKYTMHSAQPVVEFGRDAEGAYFVRDNGAGFDMALADRLFRPFSRLHRADEFSGTGIGLAIVARIVSRHGGRVWAVATKGRGATFHFTLR